MRPNEARLAFLLKYNAKINQLGAPQQWPRVPIQLKQCRKFYSQLESTHLSGIGPCIAVEKGVCDGQLRIAFEWLKAAGKQFIRKGSQSGMRITLYLDDRQKYQLTYNAT